MAGLVAYHRPVANKKKPRRRPNAGPPPRPTPRHRPEAAPGDAAEATDRPKAKASVSGGVGTARTARGNGGSAPKANSRAARIQAAQDERRRRDRRRRFLLLGVVVAVVAVAVTWNVLGRRSTDARIAAMETGSCLHDSRADSLNRDHVGDPAYDVDPPAGGPHLDTAAAPGVYRLDAIPPDGQLVHSLEHGDIVIWHPVDITAEQLDILEDLTFTYDNDVLVVPRLTIDQGVAATAWGKRLICSSFEPESLERFIEEYRDKGPERFD